jgi:hypothetical protein
MLDRRRLVKCEPPRRDPVESRCIVTEIATQAGGLQHARVKDNTQMTNGEMQALDAELTVEAPIPQRMNSPQIPS